MANIYVRSTTGSDSNSGVDWTSAKATISGAASIAVAGDTIFVSQSHVESYTSTVHVAQSLGGTTSNPCRVICANDTDTPPAASSQAALIQSTGGVFVGLFSKVCYFYGIRFKAGSSLGGTVDATSLTTFEKCAFEITAGADLNFNSNVQTRGTLLKNTNIKLASGAYVDTRSSVIIEGGVLEAGSACTNFYSGGERLSRMVLSGFDMRNAPTSMNISSASSPYSSFLIKNCALPANWTGALHASTPGIGTRLSMYNCDSGDTNYKMRIAAHQGVIRDETSVVRSGGASDGVTPISWKLTSNANANYFVQPLETDEIVAWNDSTGVSKTVTVEVLTDGVTLKDDECWVEVQYLGTSGFPLGVFASDAKADVLATSANQTASTAAWTTTGLTTPVKQKLSPSRRKKKALCMPR